MKTGRGSVGSGRILLKVTDALTATTDTHAHIIDRQLIWCARGLWLRILIALCGSIFGARSTEPRSGALGAIASSSLRTRGAGRGHALRRGVRSRTPRLAQMLVARRTLAGDTPRARGTYLLRPTRQR